MYLDYEKKLLELKERIDNLQALYRMGNKEVEGELRSLQREFRERAKKVYSDLSPWDRVRLARHNCGLRIFQRTTRVRDRSRKG